MDALAWAITGFIVSFLAGVYVFTLALCRAAARETPKPTYPEWLPEPREGRGK